MGEGEYSILFEISWCSYSSWYFLLDFNTSELKNIGIPDFSGSQYWCGVWIWVLLRKQPMGNLSGALKGFFLKLEAPRLWQSCWCLSTEELLSLKRLGFGVQFYGPLKKVPHSFSVVSNGSYTAFFSGQKWRGIPATTTGQCLPCQEPTQTQKSQNRTQESQHNHKPVWQAQQY